MSGMTTTATKDERRMGSNEPRPIYLDYQATTPMDPRVLQAMMPYFTEKFGNPHSRNHLHGWESEQGVETARAQIADLINADAREIVFTSGATESNNLAIAGVARFYKDRRGSRSPICPCGRTASSTSRRSSRRSASGPSWCR
jgi:cysteine desulfurase